MSLRGELDQLEHILESYDPLPALDDLAEPSRLDFLFQVELRTLLRRGPGDGDSLTASHLLAIAQEAATLGVLPLSTATELRTFLDELGEDLRQRSAWHLTAPLWWEELPDVSDTETSWRTLRSARQHLPDRPLLTGALGSSDAPLWLALPELLPTDVTQRLHRQLRAAFDDGSLELAPEGVGAEGRLSARRSDSVTYLDGLDAFLLRTAPDVAALVQWLPQALGARLTAALPDREIFPPQKAMLARYPSPSVGYQAHLDNPGGTGPHPDNGRTLTLVLYLNGPDEECVGGEIAVWPAGASPSSEPAAVLPARSGSAVLFDSRTIAHQVRPVHEGPARWALTLWFNDTPQRAPEPPPLPPLSLTDIMLPVADPPLPDDAVLFHELDDADPAGKIHVYSGPQSRAQRAGIVCTVYRGGRSLDSWCAHHLALGFAHLILIFDHLEEPEERADAERLRASYPREQLTIWSGEEVAETRWSNLDPQDRKKLLPYARSGPACYAVAARQTLNASAALEAARGEELGGRPLDWLLHLDADELFYLEGAGRGGATLSQHLAAADAAGLKLLRYVDHELLKPCTGAPVFKRNPQLAATRLGIGGWAQIVSYLQIAPTDPRPYFAGYFNGKSAVAVASGTGAAGVHGWRLTTQNNAASRFLAGPSILHFHFGSSSGFARKYLAAVDVEAPPGDVLFEPSPVEVRTFEHIRALREEGADEATILRELEELHGTLTTFSEHDIEILSEAGLLLRPVLEHSLLQKND